MSGDAEAGPNRGAQVRLILGFAVSAVCLALLLWNIEWQRVWVALQGAEYLWLLPSVASVGLALWFKVIKWQLLLLPAGRVSQVGIYHAMMVGYLVTIVLPGRLGELARVYVLARLERVSPAAVLSTVAVDRVLDVVMLVLLLAAVLPTAKLPGWVGDSGLVVGAGGMGLLAVSLLLAYPWGRGLFLKVLASAPRFPGKALVERSAEELCLGMEGLRGVGAQARVAGSTAAVWLVTVLTFYFGFLAFHIQAPLWAAVLVLAMTNLGMVVPAAPGSIGVYHYLVVIALGAYGVEREVALGFAFVIHLVGVLPVGLGGVISLWRCGLTLTGWREVAAEKSGVSGQKSAVGH